MGGGKVDFQSYINWHDVLLAHGGPVLQTSFINPIEELKTFSGSPTERPATSGQKQRSAGRGLRPAPGPPLGLPVALFASTISPPPQLAPNTDPGHRD